VNFNAPIPRASQPYYHEGSSLRSNRDGDAVAKQWQKNRTVSKSVYAVVQALEQTQKEVNRLRRRIIGGGFGGGELEIELYDPTEDCFAGTIYKIRTTDAAAVTGIEVSEETFIKAMPGKFYCLKDVPANPTEAKHIPQIPDGSGQTDPEHADKHWEFITPATICTATGPVEV